MKPVLLFLLLALFLAACSPALKTQPVVSIPTETAPALAQATVPAPTQATSEWKTLTDQQGSVTVDVTPMNLDTPGETMDFDVSLNTHSVDLSMDLATLATLATNTGLQVEAISWDGPRGGHHVEGTLSFPAIVNGNSLLASASQLILTIKSVDAAARIFTWNINP